MSDFTERIAKLSPKQQEKLFQQLGRKKNRTTTVGIKPMSRTAAPLLQSFNQQRLWFLEQLSPGQTAYNFPLCLRLTGPLNVAVLEQSLTEIVRRHETLRTTFAETDGQPAQVIHPPAAVRLSPLDLRTVPESQRSAELQRLTTDLLRQPFDLQQGPLFRTLLAQMGDVEHFFMLVVHHIVFDGWSAKVLLQELTSLYQAFSSGQSSPLPDPTLQYADFAHWQRRQLSGEALDKVLRYWQRQLADAPAVLDLPTDRPRPAVQTFRGATQSFTVPAALLAQLKSRLLRPDERLTLFMVLLAAFKVLLFRYTGQADLVIGSPVAGRNRTELESLIGFFVNNLALRTDLSGDPTFSELLQRVREVTLAAYAHQELPFEKLVDAVQPERDLSYSPLFQVMFALLENPFQAKEFAGLTVSEAEPFETHTSRYDLILYLMETPAGLLGTFEYSTDLFEPETVARMVGHLQTLLAGIAANPHQRLSELPLLTLAEHRQLLVEWNDTRVDYPPATGVHTLFEAQARQTPDGLAVASAEQRLTYQELDNRANQVAHYLQRLGIGPGSLVGVCTGRTVEMVIGLLGVLKAGAAYVPLDPSYPPERLAFMLTDAEIPVLLTQERILPGLPDTSARLICLDRDWPLLADESQSPPSVDVSAGDLAYIIYTSGSTGIPKGVEIEHRGLVNLCRWHQRVYQVTAADRATQIAAPAFDASVWEIWPYLTAGASVHLPDEETKASPARLLDWLAAEAITITFLPTPLAEVALEQSLPANLALRILLTGGDKLQHSPRRELPFRLVNNYGPTEYTVVTTWTPVASDPNSNTPPPIGRPVDNTRLYVLDSHMQPVPIGVPGELYIGGPGLARGYHNRPELTAEKFISDDRLQITDYRLDTEKEVLNSKLYKTGDLVRYLPDGNLEFLGRVDHQVKLRGFRIELGEIESLINQYAGARQTVVLLREDEPGHKRLVAYVVPDSGQPLQVAALQRYLKEKLPAYMVPSAVVLLETMPLNPNGKIDRAALPAPDASRPDLEADYVAPRTPVEQALADLWAKTLGLKQVGIHDNFFELGGDSILSLQVVSKANQAGLPLAVTHLFQHQTIAQLAQVVGEVAAVQAEQGPVTGALPLTPIQRWFFAQELPERHHFNQAVLLELRQPPQPALLEQALQHLLFQHDALRLRYRTEDGAWQQVIAAPDETVSLWQMDLAGLPADEQTARFEASAAEAQTSLNLTDGPLLRGVLFDFGPQRPARLLLVIHHLAVDGVSWRILLDDLQTAIRQLGQRQPVTLPLKTTSFKAWAQQLTQAARSEPFLAEADFWLTALPASVTPLPLDFAGGYNSADSIETMSVALSEADTRALLHDAPAAYNTQINDILLTALGQAFAGWTGASSLLVHLEGHGREDIFEGVDVSRTVGWFTTLFPVLLPVNADTRPGPALKAVKEQLRQIPHKGLGYGLLRYLGADDIATKLAALPQPEVSFNYLGQFDQLLPDDASFNLAVESTGPTQSRQGQRPHLIDINSMVSGGQLRLTWSYSTNLHRPATIERLAQSFLSALRALIAHCQSAEAGGYTPSDFPLARLDQATLDRLTGPNRQLTDIYPLSPLQQGMLFHTLVNPQAGIYFQQITGLLNTALNVDAFKRAWQQVIERHPVLRTTFAWEGLAEPLQLVQPQTTLVWQIHDWRRLPPAEQPAQLAEFLRLDRQRGFKLAQLPPLRVALARLADDAYQFVWSFHHLLLDGWSVALVLQEVFNRYEALCRNEPLALPAAPPYRQHIAWLRRQDAAQAKAFWGQTLAGLSAPTPLGIDRTAGSQPEPDADEELYQERTLHLPAADLSALSDFARRHQLTLNTLVQGAWATLLSRYSGQGDVLFGTTVSGRAADSAGVENMVGLFINTLPVRVAVPTDETTVAWLKTLQAQQVTARQFEYSSLVDIHGWSDIPLDLPLFESLLVFENYPVDAALQASADRLAIRQVRAIERTNFPLTLVAVPEGEAGLRLLLIFDSRRFEAAAIERMLDHLQILLHGLLAHPAQSPAELPLLTAAERQQLLVEWNDTAAPYPQEACIHHLFAAQAEQTPTALAVTAGRQQLTYAELEQRANQVAHRLRAEGITPGDLVGVCMERSVEFVVAILGVVKAGGAYVPLDPTYPAERLAFMLADAQIEVLLSQERVLPRLPQYSGRVICLDRDWPQLAAEPITPPAVSLTARDLAYVIYTSGSTGQPKGVELEHRGLVNLCFWHRRVYQVTAADRATQIAAPAFDASVWELWPYLISGAAVFIPDDETRASPAKLAAWLAEQAISITFLPTPLAELVLEQPWPAHTALRALLTGGDKLHHRPQTPLPFKLYNNYGPTENTVVTTWTPVESNPVAAAPPPIGRPVDNCRLYVLDSRRRPVPIGVPGELFIGGDSLARGYHNRPDLTAEKFIANPFARDEDGRRKAEENSFILHPASRILYRTGDLVRYLPDGNLEFLGRIDQQVKIRGFRIELGEIEAALGRHPAVRQCAVIVQEDAGDKRLAAAVVPNPDRSLTPAELRHFLAEALPDYMVPAALQVMAALPLTPNGKVDRRALARLLATEAGPAVAKVAPQTDVEQTIADVWRQLLKLEQVGLYDNFFDLGGHSLLIVQAHDQLRRRLDVELQMADMFQYPTIAALAEYVTGRQNGHAAPKTRQQGIAPTPAAVQEETSAIAIIGMAGRFPKAKNLAEFWQNLHDGVEGITFFSEEELEAAGIDPALLGNPNYVKANGMLAEVDLFDAAFFGFNPREAALLDPQHRLFLECAWEALEEAGYDPNRTAGSIGVYAGSSSNTYLTHNLAAGLGQPDAAMNYQTTIGNDKDFLPTRVSYKLNLTGPSVSVQTACSTSLVAVQMACQALLGGQCDLALAGGVSVSFPQQRGYLYQEGMILSPDGHCRTFDADAQGTIGGEGVGLVVLKRLNAALADGDHIHAVIKGAAINNDGAAKVGYTAPSVSGQAAVIARAQATAGVTPESISYIEAHGTATPLGDPTEIAALTQAFRLGTDKTGFCAIGSVKSNLGHLDAAAGVAGLLKTVLALKHRQLPPSLHYQQPNPEIDFEASPFYVNTTLTDWPAGDTPRRAGVSSFGIGGTNAHVVLEEAPSLETTTSRRAWHLLPLSAKSDTAVDAAARRLADYLRDQPEANLADVAYTLQAGRDAFNHRRVVVCRDSAGAIAALTGAAPSQTLSGQQTAKSRGVAFMFPGQGAQHVNMALGLYQTEPTFRAIVDECDALLRPHLGGSLLEAIYPNPRSQESGAGSQEPESEGAGEQESINHSSFIIHHSSLKETWLTQPALFAIEYALARLWQSWGIQPQAMIGHSIGEYVAACLAGVFSLEEALALVAARGRLMQQLPPGAMLAVFLAEAEVQPFLNNDVSVAVINSPDQCVVSGPIKAIESLQAQLAAAEIGCRRLKTSHAFHSAMMEPILADFRERVAGIALKPPQLPFVSNVSGAWITVAQATSPDYWVQHLRKAVRFGAGLAELLQTPEQVLLEVGPGQTLSTLARRHPQKESAQVILSSLPRPQANQNEAAFLLTTLGQLWLAGVQPDWPGLYPGEQRQRVSLPTYPFERQRYWIEPQPSARSAALPVTRPTADKKPDIADWFYVPSWQRRVLLKPPASTTLANQNQNWLIFMDGGNVGHTLANWLRQAGQSVTAVSPGDSYSQHKTDACQLNPLVKADYETLLRTLRDENRLPDKIVHLWSLLPQPPAGADEPVGFFSLLYLAQAWAGLDNAPPVDIELISTGGQQVTGREPVDPAAAAMLGLNRIIPQEFPQIRSRTVDIELPAANEPDAGWLTGQLVAEMTAVAGEPVVAYRGLYRWLQRFEPARLRGDTPAILRQQGVYLITGGLGGVGLALAGYLAQAVQARLVLLGRSAQPERATWPEWLAAHDSQDKTSVRIRRIRAMEEVGAEVLVLSTDAGSEADMRAALQATETRFGPLHGVIHAAGVGAMTPLAKTGAAEWRQQFRGKARGALVLEKLLAGRDLDFCLLTSSLSALLGGLGLGAYAAANAFLDAVAQRRNQAGGTPWITVNWDGWQPAQENGRNGASGAAQTDAGLTPQEGVETFKRILSLAAGPQVAVSVTDLNARFEQWVRRETVPESAANGRQSLAPVRQPRPNLATDFVAPGSALEQNLAAIWQELLGIEPIGLHDNFFDLGGDSLLIVQLHSRLQAQNMDGLSVDKLFEYPTIGLLARYLGAEPTEKPLAPQVRSRTERQKAAFARQKQLMKERRIKS